MVVKHALVVDIPLKPLAMQAALRRLYLDKGRLLLLFLLLRMLRMLLFMSEIGFPSCTHKEHTIAAVPWGPPCDSTLNFLGGAGVDGENAARPATVHAVSPKHPLSCVCLCLRVCLGVPFITWTFPPRWGGRKSGVTD